jgi:hypothetical protein
MPQSCDGSEPKPWSVGASASGFDTDIIFDGHAVHTRQFATSVSVGRSTTPRWSWAVTGSYVPDGTIENRDVIGGAALGVSASYLQLYERARRPFIAFSGSAGVAQVRAVADDGSVQQWTAGDVRAGVAAGKTFGPVVPYAAARVFGGPVFWHRGGASVVGGDSHHITLGGGLTVRLPASMDFTAEIMPLGERSFAAGLTVHR